MSEPPIKVMMYLDVDGERVFVDLDERPPPPVLTWAKDAVWPPDGSPELADVILTDRLRWACLMSKITPEQRAALIRWLDDLSR